jgi:hypothetical protein
MPQEQDPFFAALNPFGEQGAIIPRFEPELPPLPFAAPRFTGEGRGFIDPLSAPVQLPPSQPVAEKVPAQAAGDPFAELDKQEASRQQGRKSATDRLNAFLKASEAKRNEGATVRDRLALVAALADAGGGLGGNIGRLFDIAGR